MLLLNGPNLYKFKDFWDTHKDYRCKSVTLFTIFAENMASCNTELTNTATVCPYSDTVACVSAGKGLESMSTRPKRK